MKVILITPWDNAWVPFFAKAIKDRGHEFKCVPTVGHEKADVFIHGWAGQSQAVNGARNIVFLRRYELFSGGLGRVNWKDVDALICVNSWVMDRVKDVFEVNGTKTPVHLIYNGTDLEKWKFKERKPNKKIGMACHVHPKKNLPLALQVLALLPDYELHIAGEIQDPCTAEYLNHAAKVMRRRIYLYGHVDEMNLWWEQMGVCLSTSLSEGNPNNVIEAMAKGIKPVVHCWPGSEDQFGEYVFGTAQEGAEMIQSPYYASAEYRAVVGEKFSLKNIERVVDIALQTETECAS